MENAEVMVLGGILLIIALCIVGACYIAGKYSTKVQSIYRKVKAKVMWNSIIRYFF